LAKAASQFMKAILAGEFEPLGNIHNLNQGISPSKSAKNSANNSKCDYPNNRV